MVKLVVAFVGVLGVVLSAACGDTGNVEAPTATGTPISTITATAVPERATPTPTTTRQSVPPGVDVVIRAVLARNIARLEELTDLVPLPCGPQAGPGSPPACPPGLPEETRVAVLPVVTCEGELRPRSAVRPTLEDITNANPQLAGVYRVPTGYRAPAPGDYIAVFSRQTPQSGTLGAGLLVSGEKVVTVVFGCQASPDQIAPPGSELVLRPG